MDLHKWDLENVFHDGDSYFKGVENDLLTARVSVDVETYIFSDDDLGRQIAHELANLARRGLRVRILVDGAGSPYWSARTGYWLKLQGAHIKIFHPVPWRLRSLLVHGIRLFKWLNRRNHRKVFIIDDKVAWLGSLNISGQHLKTMSGAKAWRDTGVRLEGHPIATLKESFDRAWNFDRLNLYRPFPKASLTWAKKTLIRVNDTWLRRRRLYHDLLRRLRHARHRVWLTNAYFIPSRRLLRALRRASENQVDVRILVPARSDIFFIRYITSAYYYGLLKANVKIYEYQPTFLHAKTILIDDWAVVGSSNLNHRSMLHDLEVDAVVTHPETKSSLADQFSKDIGLSHQITMADWKSRSLNERFWGALLYLLRYWL